MSLYPVINDAGRPQKLFSTEAFLDGQEAITRGEAYQKLAEGKVPNNFYGREVKEMELKEKRCISAGWSVLTVTVAAVGLAIIACIASFSHMFAPLGYVLMFGGGVGLTALFVGLNEFNSLRNLAAKHRVEREDYLSEQLNNNQLQPLLNGVKERIATENRRAVKQESEISALMAQF